MQLRFCADTLRCRHIFMQYDFIPLMRPCFYAVRLCTAYAATLLGSPFMRSCFCAVMLFYADEAFAQSRFYVTEPFTQAHFTQRRPLHGDLYTAIFLYGRILMRLRFLCSHAFTLYWMEMVLTRWKWFSGRTILRGKPQGYLRGWPCPCAALWVSRPSRPAPLPAGRRRWNPGRIFHGWRPWCAPASPAFPAAG